MQNTHHYIWININYIEIWELSKGTLKFSTPAQHGCSSQGLRVFPSCADRVCWLFVPLGSRILPTGNGAFCSNAIALSGNWDLLSRGGEFFIRFSSSFFFHSAGDNLGDLRFSGRIDRHAEIRIFCHFGIERTVPFAIPTKIHLSEIHLGSLCCCCRGLRVSWDNESILYSFIYTYSLV